MKRILSLFLSLVCINTAYSADNLATVQIKTNHTADEGYYLCLSNAGGCISFANGEGRTFPINAGQINNAVLMDTVHRVATAETLPASCQVFVQNGQKLVIRGTISKGPNHTERLSNLKCSIA